MNNSSGGGHPVLGVVLGIIGILVALLLVIFTGAIGCAIACILGIAAIILGISARRKSGRGIGAVITGALAIILAIVAMVSTVSLMSSLKQKAAVKNRDLSNYMNKPHLGLMGILYELPKDKANINHILDQLNDLNSD